MSTFADLYGFLTAIFSTAAIVMTYMANFWCNFVERTVTVSASTNITGPVELSAPLNFGIWGLTRYSYSITETGNGVYLTTWGYCQSYRDTGVSPDTKWKSAMAFTIVTAILGFITGIGSCVFSMCIPMQGMWKVLALGALLTTVFQGMTFIFFSSNACTDRSGTTTYGDPYAAEPCVLARGGKMAIAATVFWFVSFGLATVATASGNAAPDLEAKKTKTAASPTPAENGAAAAEE